MKKKICEIYFDSDSNMALLEFKIDPRLLDGKTLIYLSEDVIHTFSSKFMRLGEIKIKEENEQHG